MTDEIKTPRTDAAEFIAKNWPGKVVGSNFARQLEHELAIITQERDALRKKLEEAYERAAQVVVMEGLLDAITFEQGWEILDVVQDEFCPTVRDLRGEKP